jgi:hypothetical protein
MCLMESAWDLQTEPAALSIRLTNLVRCSAGRSSLSHAGGGGTGEASAGMPGSMIWRKRLYGTDHLPDYRTVAENIKLFSG